MMNKLENRKKIILDIIIKNKFLVLFFLITIYSVIFIFRFSFVIDNVRYFTLFDDEMISMRYAKNFAKGYGLVWNIGEKIEGYTNPLWVIFMSLFHLFPIPASKISLFIQISGLIFFFITLMLIRKISFLITNSEEVAFISVLLTGCYYPLIFWSLVGTEVSILMLLTAYSVFTVIKNIKEGKNNIKIYLILGISTLIRIDMVVLYLAFWLYLIFFNKENRIKEIFIGLLNLMFFLGIQTIFRYYYYGELLPNTYYLKMTGFPITLRILRGFLVFLKFIWEMNIVFILLGLTIFIFIRNKLILLFLWILIFQVLYSIYIGGDAWELVLGSNRFISTVIFSFFIIFAYSINKLKEIFLEKFNRKKVNLIYNIIILLAILNFNSFSGPEVYSMIFHIVPPRSWIFNKTHTEEALVLNEITKLNAKIAVIGAGCLPYFCDRYFIDLLGKNDSVIARIPVKRNYVLNTNFFGFYPGHNKYDYKYSIGQLQPDVVVELWGDTQEAKKILDENYILLKVKKGYKFYFLKNSQNILWDKINVE